LVARGKQNGAMQGRRAAEFVACVGVASGVEEADDGVQRCRRGGDAGEMKGCFPGLVLRVGVAAGRGEQECALVRTVGLGDEVERRAELRVADVWLRVRRREELVSREGVFAADGAV